MWSFVSGVFIVKSVSVLHFFSWLSNIPLYVHATFCLSIYPSMDIWVSTFWLLQITLLWAFLYRFLCKCVTFSLRYLGMELLGHIVTLGLRSCQMVFKEAAKVSIPSSNVWGFLCVICFYFETYNYCFPGP